MKTIGVILCIPLLIVIAIYAVQDIFFSRDCGSHMVRAAQANSVELARQEMEQVVSYADKHDLTTGYTSIFYKTPEDDIGFWYRNMTAALSELKAVTPATSNLERSNILIKLKETVVHHDNNSSSAALPSGIEVYPMNSMLCFFLCLTSLLAVGGVVVFIKGLDN